jgi:hypothetical protein
MIQPQSRRSLAHVPEKWTPVFRKVHAPKQETSAADLTFLPECCGESIVGTSSPKPHWNHKVASVLLVPTLVKVRAEKAYKRRNQDTGCHQCVLCMMTN